MGSKNIGDQLITNSLKKVIYEKYKNAEIEVVFRADKWADIKNIIKNSDHVFFCMFSHPPKDA